MSKLSLKLISLVIAVLLSYFVNYFFVNSEGGTSVLQLIVPVEVQNLPQDKMILFPLTRQAEVTIQGPALFVSRVVSSPPVLKVSIPPEAQNRFVARLSKDDLKLPPYVEVVSIRPPQIEFTLDTRVVKSLPVIVPRIGSVPDNYKVEALRIKPERVEIRGPQTELKSISSIETDPLDLRDLTSSATRELNLRLPGTLAEVDIKRVLVEVDIVQTNWEEKLEGLTVEVRSRSGDAFIVSPEKVSVRVIGPRDQVKALKREDVVPFVRVPEGLKLGEKLKVSVETARGIVVVGVDPERVQVISSGADSKAAKKK